MVTDVHLGYLKTAVTFSLEMLDIKRNYRIYDGCPAIACDTYLKGIVNSVFGGREENATEVYH